MLAVEDRHAVQGGPAGKRIARCLIQQRHYAANADHAGKRNQPRIELRAVVEAKRVQTALMYKLLEAQPKKERP